MMSVTPVAFHETRPEQPGEAGKKADEGQQQTGEEHLAGGRRRLGQGDLPGRGAGWNTRRVRQLCELQRRPTARLRLANLGWPDLACCSGRGRFYAAGSFGAGVDRENRDRGEDVDGRKNNRE